MSKATLVVSAKVKDSEKVAKYKEVAVSVLKKHGATLPPKSRTVTKILAGAAQPETLLEVDFPSEENIINAFNDPEYLEVINLRDEGFEKDLNIFIAK